MNYRLFLGIPLTNITLKGISDFINQMENIPGRWTKPGNMHITTLFLGAVPEAKVGDIANDLRTNLVAEQFKLLFEKYRVISRKGIPQMIWAQYRRSNDFDELVSQLTNIISKIIEFTPDLKDTIPHITLARLKVHRKQNLYLPEYPQPLPDISVKEVVLWQSILKPDGPEYVALDNFPLKIS